MVNAIGSVHLRNGMWNTDGGIEFPVMLSAAALALTFVGPGGWSVDAAIGWTIWGWPWGVGALAVGLVTGALALATRRPTPAEPAVGRLPRPASLRASGRGPLASRPPGGRAHPTVGSGLGGWSPRTDGEAGPEPTGTRTGCTVPGGFPR